MVPGAGEPRNRTARNKWTYAAQWDDDDGGICPYDELEDDVAAAAVNAAADGR